MTDHKTHIDKDLTNKESSFLKKYLTDSGYKIAVKKGGEEESKYNKTSFEQSINWKHPSNKRK